MLGNRHVALVFALGAAVAAVSAFSTGCELIASVDRTKIPAATGGGPVGGNGPGGGGGGSAPECTAATATDDCPVTGSDCVTAVCPDGECAEDNAALGTTCTDENVPDAQVCDANGACVECNDTNDCTGTDTCDNNVCVPPHCTDGEQNVDETDEDCGGADCAPCVNGDGCIIATDCESGYCGPGGAGGAGGGGSTGTCAACSDGDCDAAAWCDETVDGGTCTPDNGQGEACGADGECTGNVNCVDDVCCDAACPGNCEACDLSGNVGTCSNEDASVVCRPGPGECDVAENCTGSSGTCPANGFEPEDTACGDNTDDGCTDPDTCNASGTCLDNHESAGTECVAESCTGSTYTAPETCNASGGCVNGGGTSSCAPYFCNGNVCDDDCESNHAQCATSHYCSGANCVADSSQGDACNDDEECPNDNCVDGVCCENACGAICMACSAAKTGLVDGDCEPVTGSTDPDTECTPNCCDGAPTPACDSSGGC